VAAGATYDPNELSRLGVLGLQPDVEAARKWYEKARQLGASEAEERLRRLRAP
jgi:TPR repeat protein